VKKYKISESQIKSLDEFIALANEKRWHPDRDGLIPLAHIQDHGFHIYAELRLKLDLSAAEDHKAASEYLKTIHNFAKTTEAVAHAYGVRILEVQGEIIHLFMPCGHSKESTTRVITFSKELHDTIKARVTEEPFAMACDYGRTVFVHEGTGSNQSVISLSPAANDPAKHLGTNPDGSRTIPARHLYIKSELLKPLSIEIDKRKLWIEIPLENVPEGLGTLARFEFSSSETLTASLEALNESARSYEPKIMSFSANESLRFDTGSADVNRPAIIQGFFMRADLDGFTAAIKAAFEDGEQSIINLVRRFADVLEFANQYIDASKQSVDIVKMPWAGDCANLLASPLLESYEESQSYLPVKLAAKWHDQADREYDTNVKWKDQLGDASWAITVAGGNSSGDDDSGNNGQTLIAKISLAHRDFLIAAGWNVGRSHDAFNAEPKKNDIVVHKTDLSMLDDDLQEKFDPMSAYKIFYRTQLSLKEMQKKKVDEHKKNSTGIYAASASLAAKLPIRPFAE
jgi:hypothetical protein